MIAVTDNLTGKTVIKHDVNTSASEPLPVLKPSDSDRIDLLIAENAALKVRIAKIEAVPIVKTALEPVEPILSK